MRCPIIYLMFNRLDCVQRHFLSFAQSVLSNYLLSLMVSSLHQTILKRCDLVNLLIDQLMGM